MFGNLATPRNVTVVGLGYVGLPLALAFSKELPTTGFDSDASRVDELSVGTDRNQEVAEVEITSSDLELTVDASCLADADFIVVTVPTPVTGDHKPDLSLLDAASTTIGIQLRERSDGLPVPMVVYESTTYPGCTEEFCGPIIERESGLKAGEGFFLGYSPERANFGDKEHTLETVIKVVSGQTPDSAKIVSDTYGLIAKAGTHMTVNIKTAEASKVIENVQRDLNIALFNEFAMIFDRMDIRSSDVFDAAATKWNFHRYLPGLVGGHCIPVDPYYLTYAAAENGYSARVVLAGRAVNETMPDFIVEKALGMLANQGKLPEASSALILGLTFKANVADLRNSKPMELAKTLATKFRRVDVYDPMVDVSPGDIECANVVSELSHNASKYDVVVVCVAHEYFLSEADLITGLLKSGGILIDVSGRFRHCSLDHDKVTYWSP